MATIKETAKAYEPKTRKNIADMKEVSVDIALLDGEGTGDDGKTYVYKFFEYEGDEYRVPDIVLSQLKDMLDLKADMKVFKVERTGSGQTTRYKVKFIR